MLLSGGIGKWENLICYAVPPKNLSEEAPEVISDIVSEEAPEMVPAAASS